MDFRRLSRALNSTSNDGLHNRSSLNFAPSILDAFLPGYSIISNIISQTAGFDVGAVVSAGVLLFALIKAWQYVSKAAWSFLTEYATSLVYLDEHDELFKSAMDWIAEQRVGRMATRIKAVTKQGSNPEDDKSTHDHDVGAGQLFHFGKWAAKVPPKYEPYYGSYIFFHNRRFFIFERGRRERPSQMPWRQTSMDEQHIQLRTLGWSTKPLKALLSHIKQWSLEREHDITIIKRPQSKDTRRREGAWSRVTSRPSRPMDTVVLDAKQKETLIADVNEYLSPASPQWYASRGIPLRRGYLFHGPPGTGKSSLSFALGGLFGLDIFVISLLDPTLTESDLQQLFNNLPKRCIVLLEDIDSAGLTREDAVEELHTPTESEYDKIAPPRGVGPRRSILRKGTDGEATSNGISLSGLLNAIDGVASHEGRILIMTSNFPEKLDPALIRPGRVDMQVAFTLATKRQIQEIFVKMYASDPKHYRDSEVAEQGQTQSKRSIATKREFSREELQPLAEKFADVLPEGTFSPAEVQNFLITRKKDPYKALEEIEQWKSEALEAKEKKNRVF